MVMNKSQFTHEAQIGHFQRSETTLSEISSSQILSVRTMRSEAVLSAACAACLCLGYRGRDHAAKR
eukprot:COSAG02_NODE_35381_length_469_cov_0.875676_1_plen_65_part_10